MHYVDNTVVSAVGCAPNDHKTHPIKGTKAFCSVQSLASHSFCWRISDVFLFQVVGFKSSRHVLINAEHIKLANALNCSVVLTVREGAMYLTALME